jgi:hypothetical protein
MPRKAKISKDKGLHERVTFLTTAAELTRLKNHSEHSGIPVATIIRRALEAYLPKAS